RRAPGAAHGGRPAPARSALADRKWWPARGGAGPRRFAAAAPGAGANAVPRDRRRLRAAAAHHGDRHRVLGGGLRQAAADRPQDRLLAGGHHRGGPAARRPLAVGLARSHRGAAHPRRLRAAAAVLCGQPLRARGRAAAGLAATPKEPRPAMGKIALWIVVIIVVMLAVRAMKPRRGDDAAA